MSETRVRVCLTNLGFKQQLLHCLRGSPHCVRIGTGRKGARRLAVSFFMTMPCVLYPWCYDRNTGISYLVEHQRDATTRGSMRRAVIGGCATTDGNVENPYRDMHGAIIISTFLFPIASEAMINTVEHLFGTVPRVVDDLQRKGGSRCTTYETGHCMETFANCIASVADAALGETVQNALLVSGATRDRVAILTRHLNFVNAIVETVKGTGMLWEKCQIAFSCQDARRGKGKLSSTDAHSPFQSDCEERPAKRVMPTFDFCGTS